MWQRPEHRAEQGKYPVFFITFKDAKSATWEETVGLIADVIAEEFLRHRKVFDGEVCPEKWRCDFNQLQQKNATTATLVRSLGILAAALHAHHGERPIILMKPRPGVTLPGVVLELKSPAIPARASQKRIDALLMASAKQAREQIDEKRYADEMEAAGVAVLKYGIGFSGKRVALAK